MYYLQEKILEGFAIIRKGKMEPDEYDQTDIDLAISMMEAMRYEGDKIFGIRRLLENALEDGDIVAVTTILGMIGDSFLSYKKILQ